MCSEAQSENNQQYQEAVTSSEVAEAPGEYESQEFPAHSQAALHRRESNLPRARAESYHLFQ